MPEIKIVAGSRIQLERMGPVIQGLLTHSDSQREIRSDDGRKVERIRGNVLFDTGASSTIIDWSTARNLDLLVVDSGTLNSATETDVPTQVYEGQVIIDGHPFHLERTPGAPLLQEHRLLALIGRDILSHGRLEYDGRTGIVTFRF